MKSPIGSFLGIIAAIAVAFGAIGIARDAADPPVAYQAAVERVLAAESNPDRVRRILDLVDLRFMLTGIEVRPRWYERLFRSGSEPSIEAAIERSLDEAVAECVALPLPECILPLVAADGLSVDNVVLRDWHLYAMAERFAEIGILGTVAALAETLTTESPRIAAFELIAERFAELGEAQNSELFLTRASEVLPAIPSGLQRAVELAHMAEVLIDLGAPGRAAATVRAAGPMIMEAQASETDKALALLQLGATLAVIGDIDGFSAVQAALSSFDPADLPPLMPFQIAAMGIDLSVRFEGIEQAEARIAAGDPAPAAQAFQLAVLVQHMLGPLNRLAAEEVLAAAEEQARAIPDTQLAEELIVELIAANAVIGQDARAVQMAEGLSVEDLRADAQGEIVRARLLNGDRAGAEALFEEIAQTRTADRLAPLMTGAQPVQRGSTMGERILSYYERGWKLQGRSIDAVLLENPVVRQNSLIVGLEPSALIDEATGELQSQPAAMLMRRLLSYRGQNPQFDEASIVARACEGQTPPCLLDMDYLRSLMLRVYVLPALSPAAPA